MEFNPSSKFDGPCFSICRCCGRQAQDRDKFIVLSRVKECFHYPMACISTDAEWPPTLDDIKPRSSTPAD